MLKFLLQIFWIGLLLWASFGHARDYKIYHDEHGAVYLEAPKSFTLVKSQYAVPMQVRPHNGLLRLYELDGEWHAEALTEAQWQQLTLFEGSPLVAKVQLGDLDADGIADLFIGLNDQITPYLTLSQLRADMALYAARGEHSADTGANYHLSDDDGDGLYELESSYSVYPKSAGRFRAMAMAAPVLAVGQTQGEFRVDESGAAAYSLPLNIPAGIAGVQPQLSLVYNSSAGDGYMGAGWNFSGASAITRCPKNFVNDNAQGRVGFDASDRLCLDGQRLINTNAPAASATQAQKDSLYWSATSYYKELSDFTIVRPHGAATQGPKAYSVETKSGEIHYYGEVTSVSGSDTKGSSLVLSLKNNAGGTETGADALFEVPGSTTARFWALKAIKDVKNNYILFKYAEDQAKGEHYLTEVQYTGRGSVVPFAKVVLNYQPASKKRIGYQAGYQSSMTQLLKSITVFQDGSQYRHYQLNYFETDVLEEKTYLTSLQECTTSAIANCYPALKFDWLKPATVTTSIHTVCASSDSLDCWDEAMTDNYVPFSATTTVQGTSLNRYHHQMIDMNGDGFSDLVYPFNNRWNVQFGNQNGAFSTAIALSAIGAAPRTIFNIGNNYLSQTIDYNGDGQRDLLVANNASSNWYIVTYQIPSDSTDECSKISSNPQLCNDAPATASYLEINTGKVAYGLDGGSFVVDYDGDGLEDIVFIKDGVFQAYVNKGMSAGTHQGFEHKPLVGYLGDIDSIQYEMIQTRYSPDSKNSAMLDINGDGKTEFLLKVTVSQCDMPAYSSPGECSMEGYTWNINKVWRVYTSKSGSYTIDDEMYQDIQNVRVVDLNGDGYSDLMYQVGTSWFYRLSNGNRLMAAVNSSLTTPADRVALTYFLDLNADGRTDMLLPSSTSNWTILLSRPHNDPTKIIFESRGSRSFDANAAIQFADTNGDSKLDLLTSTSDNGWKVALNSRNNIHDHRISTITTGWGVPTQIEYASLTKSGVYYRKISSNAISSDYFVPQAGYFVVNKVSTEVKTGKNLIVNYAYGGLLVHKKGRGLLGFEYLKTTDAQTSVVTETGYYQLWPYTGIPKNTLQKYGDKDLSFATNTAAQLTSATGGVFPYIKSSSEQSYSLNTGLTLSTQLATTASTFVYDTYGNLTSSAVTISDPANTTNKLLTNTSNTFNTSTAYQRYGRLTASTVRKRLYVNDAVTSDISRSSSFTYNADYLLETEVYSANAAASKSTTTYGYDAAGNKISVTVTAGTDASGAVVADRTSSSTYTSNFRYLASSTDAMGKVSSYKYNGVAAASFTPALIASITAVSPNTQSSTTNFDAFGQSTSSSVKGALSGDIAVTGTVTKSFCDSCESLFPDAYIKVVTSSVTGAEQQQFIDKYGREVGSKTKLPVSGLYSVSRKTYDNQGRPYQVFEPAIDAVSSYASTVSYDALGRMTQTTMANGGVSKVDYSGYSTTTTDALLKTKSSTSNYLGQLLSSTDDLGAVLSFSYNAYGDLLTVKNGTVTRVSNSYDAYGRKTAMTDVDKGSWSYVTNGFGELISQTDAKAQATVFEYNNAGQMTRRYDASGTVCWSYGSTAASYNVNQLIGVKQWTASNTACTSTATPVYSESYSYNSKALVSSKTISTGGASYTTSSTYDSYGRPYELTYPSSGSITGPKVRTEYSYGAAYKTTDYSSGSAGAVYHLTTAVNARGQSTGVTYGNGVTATFSYGDDTGWLQSNTVTKGTTTIQSYSYGFDDVGNVTSRAISFGVGSSANLKETFLYDDLHRVTSRTVNTKLNLTGTLAMTESYGYDGNGNLIKKTNVGYYQYNVTGKPNRLAAVWQNNDFTGTKYYGFTYDNNGNVTNDGKRSFTYTPFDKPSLVTQGTDSTSFSYGPNRELIKRIDARSTGTTSTLMLDGYEQITLPTGVVEHKYSVGDAIITKRSNGANETYYLHKDQQGSTTAITNAAGTTVQQFLYDPWGKQYLVNNSLLTYTSPATSKGYTGHEMVNDFEIIHMGGRTYNPVLGRFMQADPFIQSPGNLQSYNRYSYVLNNPMSMTDPSGYFSLGNLVNPLKSIVRSVLSVIPQNVGNFLISIGSKFCGPWAGACAAAATYEFSRAHGMSRSGALRAAAAAGVAAYAFGKIGEYYSDAGIDNIVAGAENGGDFSGLTSFGGNALTAGQVAGQVTAHAAVGGIVSSIGGGKFGHGFFSAGVTKGLGTPISDTYGQGVIGGTITSMVIGGTASVIAGDKFANGARTAAYQYLFNYAAQEAIIGAYAVYKRAQQVDKVVQILQKMGKLSFSDVASASELLRSMSLEDGRALFPHLDRNDLIAATDLSLMSVGFRNDIGLPTAFATGAVLTQNFLELLPPTQWPDRFLSFMDIYTSVYGSGGALPPQELVKWYGTRIYWKDKYQ